MPVLLGGAAVTPSFARRAAFVGDGEGAGLYTHGVFYCKDAFDGLHVMEALTDPEAWGPFLASWRREVVEKKARREELSRTAGDRAVSLRPPPRTDVPVPTAPFLGPRVLESVPLREILPLLDLNTLFRLHWGAKNAKGEAWRKLLAEEFQPRLERYRREALTDGRVEVRATYGYFPAASDGENLLIFAPTGGAEEVGRFHFPRQKGRERLSLADFFRAAAPPDPASLDLAALQLVTVGGNLLEEAEGMVVDGEYSEGYFLHGFGVRLAEAGAEYLHRRIRRELGLEPGRGLRYSWGYPACPDTRQHEILFRLLPARERLGMSLTEAGALIPELSTAALVVHHPDARYFSV